MPKAYRLGASRRAINALVAPLAKLGLAGRHTYVLAVRGRKTGKRYETPVRLIENGDRWLVAPYGEVAWVRNARAAGEIELMRGRRAEILRIEQAAPEQQSRNSRSTLATRRPSSPGGAAIGPVPLVENRQSRRSADQHGRPALA